MWDELMHERLGMSDPLDLLEALLRQYDALVETHSKVRIDTDDDRATHDRVVDVYRSFGIVVRERMNEAKARRAATPTDLPEYVRHVVDQEILKVVLRVLPSAIAASRGRAVNLNPIVKTAADNITQALLRRPRP